MKQNEKDYVLERTSDGGFYVWSLTNIQCNASGDSPEEAIFNLQEVMDEMIAEMYLVADFV